MTTDDNQKPRQLLDMTAALISSMDVARRGHTETDRTAWFSYKVFATRYMAIIHQLPRERFGPAELLRWLEETQECNERARHSHAKRRAALRASPHLLEPSL